MGFPTVVCSDNICLNYSPLKDESSTLKAGSVTKVDLGCHIDGYFAHVATTVIVGADGAKKVTGDVANLVVAGQTAL